jgi:hypothetical protein
MLCFWKLKKIAHFETSAYLNEVKTVLSSEEGTGHTQDFSYMPALLPLSNHSRQAMGSLIG